MIPRNTLPLRHRGSNLGLAAAKCTDFRLTVSKEAAKQALAMNMYVVHYKFLSPNALQQSQDNDGPKIPRKSLRVILDSLTISLHTAANVRACDNEAEWKICEYWANLTGDRTPIRQWNMKYRLLCRTYLFLLANKSNAL